MLKDIEFKKVDDLGLAIAREEVDGSMAWVAYLVNFGDIKKDLDAYKVTDDQWPVKINTPSGEEFSCYQYYYD